MLSSQQRTALLAAEAQGRRQIWNFVEAQVVGSWRGLGSWRDSDVVAWLEQILPVIQSAKDQTASLVLARLAQTLGIDLGDIIDTTDIRGVADDLVYQRPARHMYWKLSQGKSFTDALDQSVNRLRNIAKTDLQLAYTNQAADTLAQAGPQGWSPYYRRVTNGSENCAICLIASTQRYTRGDLMPIHNGCDCTVEPLALDEAYDQVIDPDRLEQVTDQLHQHDLEPTSSFADLRSATLTEHHGELGPVLKWKGDHFTKTADVKSTTPVVQQPS